MIRSSASLRRSLGPGCSASLPARIAEYMAQMAERGSCEETRGCTDSQLRRLAFSHLTVGNVREAHEALKMAFAEARAIVVDLTEATKIDAAGIQLLWSAAQTAQASGHRFTVAGDTLMVAAERASIAKFWTDAEQGEG